MMSQCEEEMRTIMSKVASFSSSFIFVIDFAIYASANSSNVVHVDTNGNLVSILTNENRLEAE